MLVEYRNVTKSYGGRVVLDAFSMRVEPGTVVMLLGANGAGKSTALRALLGLTRIDSGRILLDDSEYAALPGGRARVGSAIGLSTVDAELSALALLRVRAAAIGAPDAAVRHALGRMGLSDAGRRRLRRMSSGMQARAQLALASVGDPELLVLDEPFANLDGDGRKWLGNVLDDLRERGGSALIATHHRDTAELGDRWLEVPSGRELTTRAAKAALKGVH